MHRTPPHIRACRYGDIHAYTVAEAAFCIVIINLQIFIGAYIIGEE